MDKWKITSEKTILKAKLFEVKELKIKHGDREVVHDIAYRHPTVSVIPINDNLEVYLVSQYRYMLGKTTLEAMAGFINKNESPIDAAKRELKEETGITAESWRKLVELEMAASVFKSVCHLFIAKDLVEGKAKPEPGEEIELIKIPLSEAVRKVELGEINHSASMISVLLLDKLRREGNL